jgi:hypothetical protein
VSVSRSDVADLEEPSTMSEGESHVIDPGAREGPVEGGSHESCSVDDLFSETALEEPFTASEGG